MTVLTTPPNAADSSAIDTLECPLCGAQGRVLFEKRGCGVCECSSCEHRFADVSRDPRRLEREFGDDYFTGGGAGYPDYLSEGRLLRSAGRRYAKRVAKHASPGRVLDIGAAAGFLLDGFRDAGWDCVGVEPNDTMAAHARDELGLDVRTASLESFEADGETFDLVLLSQIVAHLEDPRAAFGKVASLLRPGGLCLVETWDFRSWTARLLGRSWPEYSPPSVLHWFTPETLSSLLADCGLSFVAKGRATKWLDGAHAKSLLRHSGGNGLLARCARPFLSLVPDRLSIPYPADDVFWSLHRRGRS